MTENTQTNGLLNVKEAATYLGMTTATIYQLSHTGRIEGVKQGKYRYFTHEELDAYRQKHPQSQPQTKAHKTRYAVERQPEPESPSLKMPICYRCGRQFMKTQEYTIKRFNDEADEPLFKAVCRDGRCDTQVQNMRLAYQEQLEAKKEQRQSTKLLQALKDVRAQLDQLIAEYDGK